MLQKFIQQFSFVLLPSVCVVLAACIRFPDQRYLFLAGRRELLGSHKLTGHLRQKTHFEARPLPLDAPDLKILKINMEPAADILGDDPSLPDLRNGVPYRGDSMPPSRIKVPLNGARGSSRALPSSDESSSTTSISSSSSPSPSPCVPFSASTFSSPVAPTALPAV